MLKKIIVCIIAVICVAGILTPILENTDGEDRLEVFVIAGQSNSAYRNTNVSLVNQEIDLPSHNVYYYGTESQPIYFGGMPPIGQATYDPTFESYDNYSMVSNGKWKIGGYEPILAKYISDKTNCDVLIINVGISASSIQYLQPDADGGEYMKEVIEHSFEKIPSKYKVDKIGYMWVQGESNIGTPVDEYISYFENINDWFIENGFNKGYIVQTRPQNSGNSAIAQVKMCNTIPNLILSSTAPDTFTIQNGKMVSDDLHYSQWGRIIVGEDVCKHMSLTTYTQNKAVIDIMYILPVMLIIGIIGYLVFSYKKEDYLA